MTSPITVEHVLAGQLARLDRTVTNQAPKRPNLIGMAIGGGQMQYSQTLTDQLLNSAQALGVKWIRTDCNWSWINGSSSTTFNWTWMDYIRDGCKSRGLTMLWTIGTTPAWARPSTQPETYGPTTTTEQTNFANFCSTVVSRYKADVRYWEIWNEPNLNQFWTPTPSASSYATLLQKAYNAIKGADSTATVLAGGTGGAGASPDIASVTWWADLYAAGAKNYFDIAAHHPYPDDTQIPNNVYNTGEMANAVTIRNTMNNQGDSAKPLWATECGLPTSGSPAVTETQQQTGIAGLRDLWLSRETNTEIFWYTLQDDKAYGASGSTREDFFGFIKSDGTTQKAVYADEQTWIQSA